MEEQERQQHVQKDNHTEMQSYTNKPMTEKKKQQRNKKDNIIPQKKNNHNKMQSYTKGGKIKSYQQRNKIQLQLPPPPNTTACKNERT